MFNNIKSVSLDEYEYNSPTKTISTATKKYIAYVTNSVEEDDYEDKDGKRKRKQNMRSIENEDISIFNWKLTSNSDGSNTFKPIFPEINTSTSNNESIDFPNTILSELSTNVNNDNNNKTISVLSSSTNVLNNQDNNIFTTDITSIFPIYNFNSPSPKQDHFNPNNSNKQINCNKQRKLDRNDIEQLNVSLFSNNDSNIYLGNENSINSNNSIIQNSEEFNDNIFSNLDDDYENKNETDMNILVYDMNTSHHDTSSSTYNQIENEFDTININNNNMISDYEIIFQTPTDVIIVQPILRSVYHDANQLQRTILIDTDFEDRFNLNDEIQ
jgi:hypothetical protein